MAIGEKGKRRTEMPSRTQLSLVAAIGFFPPNIYPPILLIIF
jgi:hypothetical protein